MLLEWADELLSKKWSGVDGVYGLDGVDTPQTVMTKRAPAVQTTATTTTTKTTTMKIKRPYPPSAVGLRLPTNHQSAPQPG